jgi:hypothetical protein
MKPIAQTFIINEPATGVEAVFLTKVDLFFQKKSSIFGVEVQIRETENGFPTSRVVPYGIKLVQSSAVNTSSDASAATIFEFDTPVLLRTNEQYAIVVVPSGGNPDYNIWIAALGGKDVGPTGADIKFNNQLGSLFISSNDLNFTPIQNESIKYVAYTANFTSTSATAVFKNDFADHLVVTNKIGDFISQEKLVVSNNFLQISSLTISGSNTFSVGERVFQPGGTSTANLTQSTASGIVYFANTTKVLLSNTAGAFNTTDTLRGVTSNNAAAAPSFANQTVTTTSACNVITVPDANTSLTTDFAVNNFIYVGRNTGANVMILQIKEVDALNRTLTLDANLIFTDTNAIIGRVKDDANLTGNFTSITDGDNMFLTVTSVFVNTASNFANCQGALIIGRTSHASAVITDVYDLMYEGITTTIPDVKPNMTDTLWSFSGTANNTSRTTDGANYSIANEIPYNFIDKTRVVMSRSNEFANPSTAGTGNSSLVVTATLQTSNNRISPYIDTIRNSVTTTHNLVYPISTLSGYIVSYSNTAGDFKIGDVVEQSNSTVTANGVVFFSNSSILHITNVASSNASSVALFGVSNGVIYNATQAITADVNAITEFNETGNTASSATRYISKNVILAEQQDAEDLVCFVTAYRPPGTDLKVYGKFLAGADSETFANKDWSALTETTSSTLFSSLVNRDDYVELVYGLPESIQIISSDASVNTTSANIAVNLTESFTAGGFVYITDNTTGQMNVRRVDQVSNSTSMVLSSNLSFASSNCAVGIIPDMESETGAFKYSVNSGISRYVTDGDSVFDTFKIFAVKIVLVSDNYHIVPKMADMRCLALQV